MKALVAWGSFFDRRKDMCVYTHTHTHNAQVGYSVVSPGVGTRHLEGPKNPDGLNLGILDSNMCAKYTCVCIC